MLFNRLRISGISYYSAILAYKYRNQKIKKFGASVRKRTIASTKKEKLPTISAPELDIFCFETENIDKTALIG